MSHLRHAYVPYPLLDEAEMEAYRALMTDRTGEQIEESFNEVISDLAKDKLGKGAAEQLRDAADGSIKRQTGRDALGRAISRG